MQLYSPKSIANYFIDRAAAGGEQLSPMKLQKLVYYAVGWYAGYTGASLVDEAPQAWQYGPVFPSLYHEFKEFGAGRILKKAAALDFSASGFVEVPQPADSSIRAFLENIWNSYGKYTGIALSEMTHAAGSPWDQTWSHSGGVRDMSIPFELMCQHFKQAADNARTGGVAS